MAKNSPILTVSQLNRYVKSILEENFRLKDLYLKGEISNFVHQTKSGHFYFTLKEGGSAVKAVMFSSYASGLRFEPENGMSVILRCSVSLYERDGGYQIYVTEMQPEGKGDLQIAFEQLYKKLETGGYFSQERKRDLPKFPEKIGIITSQTGAALHDILSIIRRRFPIIEIIFYPSLVQGEYAVPSLIAGLREINSKTDCDVIIIGRGGGAIEDLWAFNSEELVKEIAASRIPVVSAVGHETDFTLCDYAADVRAPTPSAAAEMAVPNLDDVKSMLISLEYKIERNLQRKILEEKQYFNSVLTRQCFKNHDKYLDKDTKNLEYLAKSMRSSIKNVILYKQEKLNAKAAKLEGFNPMSRLKSGYSISSDSAGKILKTVDDAKINTCIITQLEDGCIYSIVQKVDKKDGTICLKK